MIDTPGVATMARPKKRKEAPPKAAGQGPRQVILSVRGSAEWRDWLNRLAKHNRVKSADAIDHALVMWARATGFLEPPPER
jgi:hypothetical protein